MRFSAIIEIFFAFFVKLAVNKYNLTAKIFVEWGRRSRELYSRDLTYPPPSSELSPFNPVSMLRQFWFSGFSDTLFTQWRFYSLKFSYKRCSLKALSRGCPKSTMVQIRRRGFRFNLSQRLSLIFNRLLYSGQFIFCSFKNYLHMVIFA